MTAPLHVALVALGSHGDVHPFIGIGRTLKSRGHRVTVLTNGHFQSLVERSGLAFVSTGTDEEFHELIADPDLWDARKGFFAVARSTAMMIDRVYLALERLQAGSAEPMVMAGSSLSLGARVAQEKLGIPLATVHLAPAVFQSVYDTARLPGFAPPAWTPKWIKRALFGVINWMVDRHLGPPVNDFCRPLGLPPAKGIFKQWWNSPELVLGMFPEWFAAVQPDWPANMHAVGFPLYDEAGLTPLSASLARFLDDGTPPIAFTPGSAMIHGAEFFATSAEACRLLGRRGLLLTRHAKQIPANLPPGVIHVDYAPFSELLPRVAGLVHHGGIGTSAQALAAGTPQLVQPLSHDQFDNAARLEKLGVGRSLPAKKYTAQRAAALLGELLTPDVKSTCQQIATRLTSNSAIDRACDLIEGLAPVRTSRSKEGLPLAASQTL